MNNKPNLPTPRLTDETIKETTSKAVTCFQEMACGECVAMMSLGALGIENDLVPRIATGFSGGLARYGGTCGALNGGILALGAVFGRDDKNGSTDVVYQGVQDLIAKFEEKFGTIFCRELTGLNLLTEEGRAQFDELNMNARCSEFVREMTESTLEFIRDFQ